jgi:hypothetical protein
MPIFLRRGITTPLPKIQDGGSPLFGPGLLIQYIRSYPPYLEVFSTQNLRTRNAVMTQNWSTLCTEYKERKKQKNIGRRTFYFSWCEFLPHTTQESKVSVPKRMCLWHHLDSCSICNPSVSFSPRLKLMLERSNCWDTWVRNGVRGWVT